MTLRIALAYYGSTFLVRNWCVFQYLIVSKIHQQLPPYSAVAGTLILEWAKLAEYTGNKTYLELAEKSMRRIGTNASVLR